MQLDRDELSDATRDRNTPAFVLIYRNKWALLLAAIVFAVGTYALTFAMTPAYRAVVVVVPVSEDAQTGVLAALGGQLGGLGGLVGAGLGSGSITNERIAILSSRALANRFIAEHALVGVFCGADLIDCRSGPDGRAAPSEHQSNEALKLFTRRVLTVSEDKRTGLVRVSITWIDRQAAAVWANGYVDLANRELQRRAIDESNTRIEFLRDAAQKAQVVGVREAIYRLMESEVKSVMVATTRPDFAFRVVDRATVPDKSERVRPMRSLLALAGGIVGILVAFVFFAIRARRTTENENEEKNARLKAV